MTAGRYYKSFQIKPSTRIRLGKWDPKFIGEHTKKEALRKIEKLREQISDMQMRLYAERQRSLLICLQGQDASGKDGVVRHVIGSMNPEGCRVVNFKEPTKEELDHDFLWRIEHQMPRKGEAVIFNRSHYEEVLVVRVQPDMLERQKLPPRVVNKDIWQRRFKGINDFERHITCNGTLVLKFHLRISKEEQRKRFLARLEEPVKRWKFSMGDVTDRQRWDEYMTAYEDMIRSTSTEALARCRSPMEMPSRKGNSRPRNLVMPSFVSSRSLVAKLPRVTTTRGSMNASCASR